eukprot:TRINITY_DN5543_c0_g1_i1.p1 TRINITY_DN5543_c0_g1~~TRINITY_DN5543_c0_g1_i1.p1  ORF type:complete len:289 (-),score=54.31 TRINITY_DN5543_c0_g1_i1:466-1332(-)
MAQTRSLLSGLKVKNAFIDLIDSGDEGSDSQSSTEARESPVRSDLPSTGDEGSSDVQSPVEACKRYNSSTWASTESDSCSERLVSRDFMPQIEAEEDRPSEQLKPCLLLQMQVLRRQSFKVKNTFIDDFDSEDEEDDRLPMVATKSCPLRACAEMWPPTPAQAPLAIKEEPAQVEHDVEEELASPVVVPLEQRQPEFSFGSQLHDAGNCKPCAWFWRPLGCNNGPECKHCHLCSAADLKARKRAKKVTKKLQGTGSEATSIVSTGRSDQHSVLFASTQPSAVTVVATA